MTYYSTWQEAMLDFIRLYGQDYEDSYNLAVEFEQHLKRNRMGAWFIKWKG